MTVGERIKIRRNELGLSQSELAQKMGYSDKTGVSKAENCGDNITTTKIEKFAEALDCSFYHLMGWEEAPRTSETGRMAAELIHDKDVLIRANKLHHASTADREYIFRMMDSILGE